MKTTVYFHFLAAGILLTGSTIAQGQSTNSNSSTQSGSSSTQSGSGSGQSGSGSTQSGSSSGQSSSGSSQSGSGSGQSGSGSSRSGSGSMQSGSGSGQSGSGSMQSGSGSMQSGSGMAVSGTDKKFVMEAAFSNLAEISTGNLALQKGESPDVKSYGQQMIDSHTKAHDELKQLASTKGITLPTEPKPKHKAMAQKMEQMSGAAFDKAYVKSQVKSHKETEAAFQKELNSGKDAEIKALAQKMFPEIQHHTKMAQDLDSKMGTMTSGNTSGGSSTGSSTK